jgi:class 3 adenylate cyclase
MIIVQKEVNMSFDKKAIKENMTRIEKKETKKRNRQKPTMIEFSTIESIFNEASKAGSDLAKEEVLVNGFKELKKTKGACLFIDMRDSTGMKSKSDDRSWVLRYYNFFHLVPFQVAMHAETNCHVFIKSIGDGIMVFVPEVTKLHGSQLVEAAKQILSDSGYFTEVRISMHYCTDAYYMGFPDNSHPDYYGLGIDITSRLNGEAKPQQLVISKAMERKLDEPIDTNDWNEVGQCSKILKGCTSSTPFRILELKSQSDSVQLQHSCLSSDC